MKHNQESEEASHENKSNYPVANRNSVYTTCRMLTELYYQGVDAITDLANAVVNSSAAPALVRTLTQREYDPITSANNPNQSTSSNTEYQQTGSDHSPRR